MTTCRAGEAVLDAALAFGCGGIDVNQNYTARDTASRRLYRDTQQSKIFGVCAGVADYFGFDVTLTRIVFVLALVAFFPMTLVAYLVLAWLLPSKARECFDAQDSAADSLRQQVRSEPHSALDHVRHRFRELDMRLQRLEKYVTSERFRLDSEFRALQD
jgi:phage shock protein C